MHPLLEAIQHGDLGEVARLCAAHPSWLVGEHGFRPLNTAAQKGIVELVACLLDHGADPNVSGHFGHESPYNGLLRPLHAAASGGHAEVVDLLLLRGAEVMAGNRYTTPLLAAADAGHKQVVKVLVKAGAKMDIFVAAALGKAEAARTLLGRDGTRAKRRTELGVTALMIAAAHGQAEVAELLLEAGADPRAKDLRANRPLDYAAGIGHYDPAGREDGGQAKVATLLVGRGADVNSRNWRGVTPLHHAARTARVGVAKVLLVHGALVDAVDVTGETPLRRAVINGPELDMVRVLLGYGADVNARDKRGRRILAAARGAGMKGVLRRAGGR